ncbi:MAG: dehydrogenase [Acidimicrobiia bacterium]|jgi:2-oxoisovalerate dehydrogenase E1 component|nr:dehydrogenase [Acidimicrobiia bacterium]
MSDDDGLPGGGPYPDAALYERLLLPRVVEEKMLKLLTQGRLSKWFSGIGQEAVAVGAASALRPDDWLLPLHRNLGVFTTRSRDLPRLFRQLLGRADGHTQGRDRSFHFGDLDDGIVGMISHLGAMLPVACGLALAGRLRGEDRVALVFCGDGTASEGDVHEAMNLAAVWRLPVVFLVENNAWGLSTPASEQYACANLADRAIGYGMPGEVIDGNDVLAVVDAVGRAAERGRAGGGPTLIEALTFRMRGHEETSGTAYVPPELLSEWAGRDPITRFEAVLDAGGGPDAATRTALRDRLRIDVDRLVADALAAPVPVSSPAVELADVYGPRRPLRRRRSPVTPHGERRYVDAIGDALRAAMRADDSVVLLGQDIADYGGAFKVTDGFLAEFGADRVRNTPIIESGAIGAALGLALDGFLPVVELQFGDFVSCGFNQVVNNLAKTRYRWGAPVPVVLRLPVGGGTGAGPFHSQNVEAWFCHVAGLKVVAPSTPADAKALLLAALEDGNPVLYCEHKAMYRSVTGPIPDDDGPIEALSRARVVRGGRDATVVSWSIGVPWALAAAEALAADGVELEVVDLRTLLPWDVDTVLASVERTGRCLILHEAPITGGFGGEVAATVADRAFAHLDAPVRRLGALDTPVPHARVLEALHSPRDRLLPALRDLLAY